MDRNNNMLFKAVDFLFSTIKVVYKPLIKKSKFGLGINIILDNETHHVMVNKLNILPDDTPNPCLICTPQLRVGDRIIGVNSTAYTEYDDIVTNIKGSVENVVLWIERSNVKDTQIRNRVVYYLLGCIGSRGVIIYIVNITTADVLYYIGMIYIFVASKFIYSGFLELSVENPVFLKPIHALIYLAFAFCAMRSYNNYTWKILLVDLCFGLVVHSWYNIIPLVKKYLFSIDNDDDLTYDKI